MKIRNAVTASLVVASLGGLVPFSTNSVAAAPRPPRQREAAGFGLVTIATGQNLRVNVVNTLTPDPELPPNPCMVQVTFLDARGGVVGHAETAEIEAGESFSTEAIGGRSQGLVRLRPVVRVALRGAARLPPGPCVPTLEVFDIESGRTTLLLDGAGRTQPLVGALAESPADR